MKIVIVGSGAMGQLFGARLTRAGNDVTFVDTNPDVIDALNAGGVTVDFGTETFTVDASAAVAADVTGPADLIIVFTKGFHTQSALDSIRHVVGSHTRGLTLQNGLGNDEMLAKVFGPENTLVGMTDLPADLTRPGHVHTRSEGKVAIGAYDGGVGAPDIREMFTEAGFRLTDDGDVRIPIWEKVAFNSALNTISAITRMRVGAIGADAGTRQLVDHVVDEVTAVSTAEGVSVSADRIHAALENAFENHTDHKTSMLSDVEAGRRTEIDNIAGAVVAFGQRNGVGTPVLDVLCTLLRAAERAA